MQVISRFDLEVTLEKIEKYEGLGIFFGRQLEEVDHAELERKEKSQELNQFILLEEVGPFSLDQECYLSQQRRWHYRLV